MFDKHMAEKIDQYLRKNFDIVFNFEFNGLIMLFGGAVKDIIMNEPINDLDFVLLTQTDDNIKQFLDKYKINYRKNKYKGYNFFYNGIKIDISSTNDLYYAGNLNTDMLFYDIKGKQFIPIGIKQALNKNEIVDYYYQGYFKIRKRIQKAKLFINFMNRDNKKIKTKYKYNRFFCLFFAVLRRPHNILKIFSKGRKYVKH